MPWPKNRRGCNLNKTIDTDEKLVSIENCFIVENGDQVEVNVNVYGNDYGNCNMAKY